MRVGQPPVFWCTDALSSPNPDVLHMIMIHLEKAAHAYHMEGKETLASDAALRAQYIKDELRRQKYFGEMTRRPRNTGSDEEDIRRKFYKI